MEGWRKLAADIVGMSVHQTDEGALYLKMDSRDFRLAVTPHAEDRLLATGLEVADQAQFVDVAERLIIRNVQTHKGTEAECKLRRVQEFIWFLDPAGNRIEVYWGPISAFEPFLSPLGVARFVTEGLGLGHVVLPADDIERTQAFWTDALGFGLSDILTMKFGGADVKLYFNHCDNGRQHSVALAKMPAANGCVHFMVEVPSLTDLGRTLDRVQDAGLPLVMTLGQHVNDECVSFYFRSPNGFMTEVAFESVVKDWSRHSVFETTLPSLWGHRFIEPAA
jgi:3,4-dihydroxy-9,10-secoandrosta-1,3,5(10)-triene-9,17-dione 4,5-dioxygenase